MEAVALVLVVAGVVVAVAVVSGVVLPSPLHDVINCQQLAHPCAGAGGSPSMDPQVAALLAAAGRKAESFPADFAGALLSGKVRPPCVVMWFYALPALYTQYAHAWFHCQVTAEILKRYLSLEKDLFASLVWGFQGAAISHGWWPVLLLVVSWPPALTNSLLLDLKHRAALCAPCCPMPNAAPCRPKLTAA